MRNLGPAVAFALYLFAGAAAFAHPGIGIVRDAQGNVFYTDLKQVWRIDPAGRRSVVVPSVHTHELALDAAGNLYGEHLWYEGEKTDKWGHRVWRRSPEGKVTDVIPAREGFPHDYSFVRDGKGDMFWVERQPKVVFRKTTAAGRTSDLANCGDCRDVRWQAMGGDGTLYFTDAGDLRSLGPDGKLKTLAQRLQRPGEAQLLMGIWTDARRGVYVADYGHRAVKRIEPGGKVTVVARSRFPWAPSGGLMTADGTLWLLENSVTNTVRVRRIAPGGKETVY
jgi:sugar lactone lactonase YvrE